MSERAIVYLALIGMATVGGIAATIVHAVDASHAQTMACIQAGGSSTQWGCFAKGVDIVLSRAPLFGSAGK